MWCWMVMFWVKTFGCVCEWSASGWAVNFKEISDGRKFLRLWAWRKHSRAFWSPRVNFSRRKSSTKHVCQGGKHFLELTTHAPTHSLTRFTFVCTFSFLNIVRAVALSQFDLIYLFDTRMKSTISIAIPRKNTVEWFQWAHISAKRSCTWWIWGCKSNTKSIEGLRDRITVNLTSDKLGV